MRTLASLSSCLVGLFGLAAAVGAHAETRSEQFDRDPPHWEGVNHRNKSFEPRTVVQDFGYSAATNHAGGAEPGEVGGRINPAGEPAFYGYRLPQPLNLDSSMSAEGKLIVPAGSSHCLLGFFNAGTVDGWRTPNTLVARINGRGDIFHCHLEYCTNRWRAEAGVIGEIVRGERITPSEIAAGKVHHWKMNYDPMGAQGHGLFTLLVDGVVARCEIVPAHRADGITVTHFGLLPVMKAWDSPGDVWIDDVIVNGVAQNFTNDPGWEGFNNRRTYLTENIRPKFNFGWSDTQHAGGQKRGELGGLIFRGDCREPQRMGCYGDRLAALTLKNVLEARGKVAVLRAVSDSTASIGFYNSKFSMQSNPSQKEGIPADFLGINIEGPSSEGFFFYPVYRGHDQGGKALGHDGGKSPRIYPDGKVHDWSMRYDPAGSDGHGEITVMLDRQSCTFPLAPGAQASFDRFGICTPWIDGNSVTVFFDDLVYTSAP
jgi:hypothetical protein